MGSFVQDTDYKIGPTKDKLVRLRDIGIGPPDQVTFRHASVYYVRADLSRIGDGFSTVTWVWDVISNVNLSKLLVFLHGADYIDLFIKTDLRDGTVALASNAFRVYSCKMWKPILSGEEGTPIVRSYSTMQTVQIKFVDLIELPGYM